jgi:hypothetical protein
MLVYLKNAMSYTVLDGKRIYGKKFAYGSFGPTDINIDTYMEKRDILEEAEYTKRWLDNKFNTNLPNVSFKLSELYNIDIKILSKIALCIGIKYFKPRKVSIEEKKALCRAIKKILN